MLRPFFVLQLPRLIFQRSLQLKTQGATGGHAHGWNCDLSSWQRAARSEGFAGLFAICERLFAESAESIALQRRAILFASLFWGARAGQHRQHFQHHPE